MEQVISFPGLGIGEFTIDRVALSFGGFHIYWYGVIIAAAFLAAVTYILKRTPAFGLDADRAFDVVIGAVIGGIIGARLYYVAFSWDQYKDDLSSIFKIWEGGIAIYGGVLAGFLVGYLVCRWRKVKFLPMADLALGGVILGQAIGRWGNFVNVEAFGSNTDLPWGMASPSITAYLQRHQEALAAQGVAVDPSMPVHPTFFYESVWCLIGFFIIALLTKHRRYDGELTLVYAAWYGLGRSWIEGLRTDSLMWGSVRVSQALAILLTVASVFLLVWLRVKIKRKNDPEYLKLYVLTEEGQSVLSGAFYQKSEKTEAEAALQEQPASEETKAKQQQTTAEEETADESKQD